MLDNGFIKISRSIVSWEWYKDINTKVVFFHLLLAANWKDNRFMGHDVPRGSLVTSIGHLADEVNLSVQNVRTALKHLEETGEISVKVTNKFSLITLTNYGLYQDEDCKLTNNQQTTNKQLTNNQQTTNKQLTTTEESKKARKQEYNIQIPEKLQTPIFLEVWEKWKKYRADIKHKMTSSTEASQLKKLSSYDVSTAVAMIEQSIENGWQGLFPVKNQKNDKSWMQMLQDYHSDQPQEEGEKDLW